MHHTCRSHVQNVPKRGMQGGMGGQCARISDIVNYENLPNSPLSSRIRLRSAAKASKRFFGHSIPCVRPRSLHSLSPLLDWLRDKFGLGRVLELCWRGIALIPCVRALCRRNGTSSQSTTSTASTTPLEAFKELVQSLSDKLHVKLFQMMATLADKMDAVGTIPPLLQQVSAMEADLKKIPLLGNAVSTVAIRQTHVGSAEFTICCCCWKGLVSGQRYLREQSNSLHAAGLGLQQTPCVISG